MDPIERKRDLGSLWKTSSITAAVLPLYVVLSGNSLELSWYALFIFLVMPSLGFALVQVAPAWRGKAFLWKVKYWFESLLTLVIPWGLAWVVVVFIQLWLWKG